MRPRQTKPAPGSPTLIATKLSPPSVSDVALRPDLLAKCTEGGNHRLLLVCAPAGYGKSTLMAESSRQLGWSTAWYKMDVLDHDPTVLIASLTEAIRRHAPSFGETVDERLRNARESPITVPELLALFVSEAQRETKETIHVILDDYHEASASRELNKALDYLLANLPPNIHFGLLTRFEPSFSTAKLRLEDQMAELRYEDLRFDHEQVAAVMRSRGGIKIGSDEAHRIRDLTEGWPASVVLVSKALQWTDLPTIEVALSEPRLKHDVFSYLAEQVYQRENEATRLFLKKTSCLDYMTSQLANEVAEIDDSQRYLDYLEANQAFTFADGHRGSFRYHPLFRDYLRYKCAQEDGAQEFHRLQLRAGETMERAGDTGAAVEVYLTANETERALGCLAAAGEVALDSCRLETLESWLERLPRPLREGSGWAHLLSGDIALRQGDFTRAKERFSAALGLFQASSDASGFYEATSAMEDALYWEGDLKSAARYSRLAIQRSTTQEQLRHSLVSLGADLLSAFKWHECSELWSEAESIPGPGLDRETTRIACHKVHMSCVRGDFAAAVREGSPLLARVIRNGSASLQMEFLNLLAAVEMYDGRYREADRHVRDSLDISDKYGFMHFRPLPEDTLGQLTVAVGDFEEGAGLLQQAAASAFLADDPLTLAATRCHLGTAFRRRGDQARARLHFKEALATRGLERESAVALNCRANSLYVDGGGGFEQLHAIASIAKQRGFSLLEKKCRFFSSALRFRESGTMSGQDKDELIALLESQLELGHVHFLGQELAAYQEYALEILNAPVSRLLESLAPSLAASKEGTDLLVAALALPEPTPSSILTTVIAECPDPARRRFIETARDRASRSVKRVLSARLRAEGVMAAVGLADMTERESQVLALMADGKRNPEIAAQLFVSEATVKAHINRIFSKLGVTDRVQAVLCYKDAQSVRKDSS